MVLLGGHHDAWTFGGVDPGTGCAALLEVARALGQLLAGLAAGAHDRDRVLGRGGIRARRLDGVAEHQRNEMQEQLIAYVNTDMYMAGRFDRRRAFASRFSGRSWRKTSRAGGGPSTTAGAQSEWERQPAARPAKGRASRWS